MTSDISKSYKTYPLVANEISKAAKQTYQFSVVDKKLKYNTKPRLGLEIYYGYLSLECRYRSKKNQLFFYT